MAIPSIRVPPASGSTHVWSQLDVDLRQQAISVVAQMAFNVVKTYPERAQEGEHDDHRPQPDQAPKRALDPSLVYVRQSTLIQVRDNTASAARQYQLAKRAHTWDGPTTFRRH